jgi:hypothetical protein
MGYALCPNARRLPCAIRCLRSSAAALLFCLLAAPTPGAAMRRVRRRFRRIAAADA